MKKNNILLIIGITVLVLFIGFGTYFWYLLFVDIESDGTESSSGTIADQGSIVLKSPGEISTINAETASSGDDIEGFEFVVTNYKTVTTRYQLFFERVLPKEVDDGCTESTSLTESELSYELTLGGKVIMEGRVSDLKDKDMMLDARTLKVDSSNNYVLKVWIDSSTHNYQGKHYHYKVTLKEVE